MDWIYKYCKTIAKKFSQFREPVPNYRVDYFQWSLVCVILFGFNWKLIIELSELRHFTISPLQLWLIAVVVLINYPLSLISSAFLYKNFKTFNMSLLILSIIALGCQSGELGLFFMHFLLKNEFADLPNEHIYAYEAYVVVLFIFQLSASILFSMLPTLLVNPTPLVIWICGFAAAGSLYSLIQIIIWIRKNRHRPDDACARIMYLIANTLSLTIPALLTQCFHQNKDDLAPVTQYIVHITCGVMILRLLHVFIKRRRYLEKTEELKEVLIKPKSSEKMGEH